MGLITLATFKTEYGLDGSRDAQITALITRFSNLLAHKCGRTAFESAAYTDQIYSGTGGARLFVKDYPVTVITSLYEVDPTDGTATLIDATEYEKEHACIYMSAGFMKDVNNYKINFTAGYATIPYDLQEACTMLVMRELKNPGRAGISGEGFGYSNVSFLDGLPTEVKDVIRKYTPDWLITGPNAA